MSDYERDETRAALERLFWRARVARDVLNAATADPDERAKAACHWALLYRVVHSPRRETAEGRTRRLDFFESLAAMVGIAPLSFYLREFALDIGHAILVSPDPVTKLARILHGPPKRGRKKRSFRRSIEIAVDVEKLHATGMTLAKAYESVASSFGKSENVTSDAVRIVHEQAMKDRANASLVHLVAAGEVEF
jgi:hypothetical protein